MIGGAVEALAGGTLAVVTSGTVAGAVTEGAVFVHGCDVASTGFNKMISGQDQSTLTNQGLQAVGMSKSTADMIDEGISIAVTMGTLYLTSSSKMLQAPTITQTSSLGGNWITTNESMSAQAAQYQSFITRRAANQSYFLNGVKFDGVVSNTLVDAKSAGYASFVNKNGIFYDWFKGAQGFVDQARRQIQAANGEKIQFFFKMKLL